MSSIINPVDFISNVLVGNASIVKEGDNERQIVADLEKLKSLNVVHCPCVKELLSGQSGSNSTYKIHTAMLISTVTSVLMKCSPPPASSYIWKKSTMGPTFPTWRKS